MMIKRISIVLLFFISRVMLYNSYTKLIMLQKNTLIDLYLKKKQSAKQISLIFECSENQVHYWLKKYEIKKRSISDATYTKANPDGNPYSMKKIVSNQDWFNYGLGLGLYWGEGNKANTHAVRLGNTDPGIIKTFLLFLNNIYKIDNKRLHFGLQIFGDINPEVALSYWCKVLKVKRDKFHKVTITNLNRKGTYLKKSEYGVLTIYFSNKKLRDIIVGAIDELRVGTNSPM